MRFSWLVIWYRGWEKKCSAVAISWYLSAALPDVGGGLFQRGYLRGAASAESWDQRSGICNLTLFGVFASLYFIKRGSIWGIGAFHSIWNLVQGNFWGLRVSGGATECSVFRTTMVEGRDIINGGAFGPEGGLAVTVVLLAGICVLLRKKKHSRCTRGSSFWRYDMFDEFGERELSEVIVESVKSWRDFLLW